MNNYLILISGDFNSLKNNIFQAGVYMASGIYTSSSLHQPIYIGSSVNLKHRIQNEHIHSLNSNNHENSPFQNAWNKYGQNSFVWWLLEACDREETLIFEQKYLDLYRPFIDESGGFNIAYNAASPCKGKFGDKNPNFGKKMSIEHKERLRLLHVGMKVSDETKKLISEAHKNKKVSDDTKLKMSIARKNAWDAGLYNSEEYREKLRKQHTGRIKGGTKIRCIETRIEYPNANYCGKVLGVYPSNIYHFFAGRLKSVNGYTFEKI